MDYIISESQYSLLIQEENKKFVIYLMNFFDADVTPDMGWQTKKEYMKELKENGGELFIFKDEDMEIESMWYSSCKNINLEQQLPPDKCPLVTINKQAYNKYNGLFNDLWKPYFLKWFNEKTGLAVNYVDSL
jgi:hypothetical protein